MHGTSLKITNISLFKNLILEQFSINIFPMRYNSEALDIKVVISGNSLLFKDIKISLGLLTSARKNHALCRENHKLQLSTNTNNRISLCYRSQYSKQILALSTYLIRRSTLQVYLAKTVAVDWFSFLLSLQNYHLPSDSEFTKSTTI